MPLPARRTHGFTVIELLVVVSIISLLIAILLPSLGKAKRVARQVYCLTNTRNLAQAVATYQTDNKTTFPLPTESDAATRGVGWNTVFGTAAEGNRRIGASVWFNAVDPYLNLKSLAFEPLLGSRYTAGNTTNRNYSAMKECVVWSETPIAAGNQTGNRTIKMNEFLGKSSSTSPAAISIADSYVRESDLARTGGPVVLFTDGQAMDIYATSGSKGYFLALPNNVGPRHGQDANGYMGGVNVSFTDGSAKLVVQTLRLDLVAPVWFNESKASPDQQVLNWYRRDQDVP